MTLENGRPTDLTGRLPKEVRCYELLEKIIPAMHHEPRFVTLE